MEHREAHDAREATVLERHCGRVRLHDLNVLVKLASQPLAVARRQLQHRQRARAAGEHARRRAKARAYLQYLIAEIHAAQAPWQQLAFDAARPPARRTDQAVNAVHDSVGSIGVEGYSARDP